MPMPQSYTWRHSVQAAERLLRDRNKSLAFLMRVKKPLENAVQNHGKLSKLKTQAVELFHLLYSYQRGECNGPSYHTLILTTAAFHYMGSTRDVRDFWRKTESTEEIFEHVLKEIELDFRDFQAWRQRQGA
jgi:hypothetical protein